MKGNRGQAIMTIVPFHQLGTVDRVTLARGRQFTEIRLESVGSPVARLFVTPVPQRATADKPDISFSVNKYSQCHKDKEVGL